MGIITKKYGLQPGRGWPLSNIVIHLSRLYNWAYPDPEGTDSLKGYFGWGNCGEWSYAVLEIFGGAGITCRVAYGDSDPRTGSSLAFWGTGTMVIVEDRSADGKISGRVFDAFNAAYKSPTSIPTDETLQQYGDVPLTDNDKWKDERRLSWQAMTGKKYIKEATSLALLPDAAPGSRLWPGNTPRPIRAQAVPTGSGTSSGNGSGNSVTFSLPLDAPSNSGPNEEWTRPGVTVTFNKTTGKATVIPTSITVTRKFTYADMNYDRWVWAYSFTDGDIGAWREDNQNAVVYIEAAGMCEVSIQKGDARSPGPITRQSMRWTATYDKVQGYCRMGITGVPSWRNPPISK